MGFVITIDGPAASGKTSVSRELAKKLNCQWVSTGAFYRGLGYVANELAIDLSNEQALVDLVQNPVWQVKMSEARTLVIFKGQDVTDHISQEIVGNIASRISQYPKLRAALLQPQRDCQKYSNLVAEGRDCGTAVFPNADAKFYLTARSEDRAQRRAQELGADAEQMAQLQKVRDAQDANRKAAPMAIPENAIVVDTSELSLAQVVDLIYTKIPKKLL